MRRSTSLMIPFLLIIFLSSYLYAGGPLNSFNGRSIVYQSSDFPVPYHPDQGDLGDFSNGQATTMVNTCFQTWQVVSTANITFQNEGQLPVDVTSTNYISYLDDFSDGFNPIIFDSDGSIIDAEYGAGASDSIIGFAGSAYNTSTGYYVEGLAVLNGKFTDIFDEAQFKATFVHEFGHFFGLDHTQINLQYVHDGNTSNDIYVPTMNPTATDDDASLGNLNPDDKAAITLLYPASSVNTVYGKIEGTATWENGQPVLGANVVAVKIGDEDMSQFSSISDYYRQSNGVFEMYVTPGDYKLFIEPINQSFAGGSSVGPYADDLNQPSFTNPVTKEYYNGEDENADETDLNDFVEVSVTAGETVSDIDFIAESSSLTTTSSTTSSTTTTITVNLKPYIPEGWSGPIVPSSIMGTNGFNKLCGGRPTYLDIAVANDGSYDITETFHVDIYIDGEVVAFMESEGLLYGYYTYIEDWKFDPVVRAGQHTLKIVVDSENNVAESNESDNEYEQTFTWDICLLWTSALYENILGENSQDDLMSLRDFRDEVLLSNQKGKKYVELLYAHSVEIALLLLESPGLCSQTTEVMAKLQPGAKSLLDGKEMTISQELMDEIELLLEEFEAKASPGLRTAIRRVKQEIKKGDILK
ncbi:MAG: hypothetical protein KAJ00_05540 [Deltaproteobacteria bacterium]|nr:hypothetical protein [Deltaproteobacteria bacterium]